MNKPSVLLSLNGKKEFVYSGFRLNEKGLDPLKTPTKEEWLTCGRFLHSAEASVQFWIGDWLLYGEKTYGKVQYEQAIELTGLDYQTLRDYKWVAARVPVHARTEKLSFYHHKEVASLPVAKQLSLLDQAKKENWPLSKLKQVKYQLSETALSIPPTFPGFLLGDCTKLLALLPDQSLDLLLTDPPYGLDYESEHREVHPFTKLENDRLEETLPMLETALALLAVKLKANSHLYIFTSWKTCPSIQAIVEKHFTISDLLVWEKNNWTAGDLDANYGQIHEFILFAQNGEKPVNGSRDGNLLAFSRVPENGRVHPTEKPLPLLEYLIDKSSLAGEVVCDPFAGVASTCLAARNRGRKFLGIEIDAQWHRQGVKRLHAV